MRYLLSFTIVSLLLVKATAQQPGPFIYKPIDTGKYIVKPGDTAAAVTSGTTTGVFRTMTRSVAGAIESNGFVKTINNLFGKRAKPETPQAGFSPLPQTNTYQSTAYPNAFKPAMPVAGMVGQTANVPISGSPSAQK